MIHVREYRNASACQTDPPLRLPATSRAAVPVVEGQQPAQIARRALSAARLGGYDVLILDTAGRTTLDEAMMSEAAEIARIANPPRPCWWPTA